jgi:transcriptional regulator with XRE-family HTH domain
MLGLSNGYLSLLETGARLPRPSVTLAQRIAVAFHRPTEEALAAQGLRAETTADRTTLIDRAFRRLVLDPELMPAGMDARHWLDAFSTRQKLQILELAQNVFAWARLADDEHADPEDAEVFDILQRFPTEAAR